MQQLFTFAFHSHIHVSFQTTGTGTPHAIYKGANKVKEGQDNKEKLRATTKGETAYSVSGYRLRISLCYRATPPPRTTQHHHPTQLNMSNKASTSAPPTFSVQSNETGTLLVWSGALRGEFQVAKLSSAIPFRKHTKHGHTDRMIWQQGQNEESPEIVQCIGQRVQSYLGGAGRSNQDESFPPPITTATNYANYYADESSHTFMHRDYNCNPNELITLVCFGAKRNLVFCSCDQNAVDNAKYVVIPMSDGTIVQFDALFNTLHYHKVLKERAAENNNDNNGPRISIQWYEPRDNQKWDEHHLQLWRAHNPELKHIQSLKRRVKRDLESTKKVDVNKYIPKELSSSAVRKRPISNAPTDRDSKVPKLRE